MIYFEDIVLGHSEVFGSAEVTRKDILAFARQFDPQPFHLDDQAAEQSLFKGLSASGWHTASLTMRLLVDHRLAHTAILGSPGFDDLRWLRPVRPGDTLHVRSTCTAKTAVRAQPGTGCARHLVEVFDQRAQQVLSVITVELVARRKHR